nr:MAG TPA: cell division protein [Caudoviricetes sp.]
MNKSEIGIIFDTFLETISDLKKENESLKFQLDNENEIDFLNSKIKELNKRILELEEDLKFERREKVKLLTKLFELE